MKYDVVIVGAGIAGTYAASELSQKGLKVLVVDREANEHTSFCGEMTSEDTLKRLGVSTNSDLIAKHYKNLKD